MLYPPEKEQPQCSSLEQESEFKTSTQGKNNNFFFSFEQKVKSNWRFRSEQEKDNIHLPWSNITSIQSQNVLPQS